MSISRVARELVQDNPVRMARIKAGWQQSALADEVGLSRSSLIAIEDGRTKDPSPEVLARIAVQVGVDAAVLAGALAAWRVEVAKRPLVFTPRQEEILRLAPEQIGTLFASFQEWRRVFSDSPAQFAYLLGLSHMTLTGYERGFRVRGMPEVLQAALMNRLGLSPEQVVALARLEPGEVVDG